MPHALTRTRAVVGGGILAVLLLACFGAPVGAQEPEKLIPVFDTSLPITVTITDTLTKPVFVGATGADDVQADHEGPEDGVWCRTQSRVVEGSRGGSRIYSVFSDTYFCYDGDELASHNPRFSTGIMFLNLAWGVAHYRDNEDGVVGDWEHWDYVTWSFQRCVNGTCGDSIHPWIKKWQRGDGSGKIRYFKG